MQDPAARDAVAVREALLANDLRGVTEVICSRTPSQILTFKQIYHSKFGSYLEHDLEHHASGDHKKDLRKDIEKGHDLGAPDGVLFNGLGPYRYDANLVSGNIIYMIVNVEPGYGWMDT